MSEGDWRCWRCHKARTPLMGLPCPDCRVILEREYEIAKAKNGGRLLYIPENFDMNMNSDSNEKRSRMCIECATDFEYTPTGKRGDYPRRCPKCVAGSHDDAPAQKPRPSVAVVAKQQPPAPIKPVVPVVPQTSLVPASKLDIPAIQAALGEEIDQLEEALSLRLRLQRAFDKYVASFA